MRRRIVLIGATGQFGQRLAALLVQLEDVEVVLTSREAGRAAALAEKLARSKAPARITGVAFERSAPEGLVHLAPWLVIDASGPFVAANYALAEAAIAAGAHWIDLADGPGYIEDFALQLDAHARSRGVSAYTGASTTPGLTVAAVRHATRGWQRIDSVDLAIYPDCAAPSGLSIVETVLSFAGRPIAVFREGRPERDLGWGRLAAAPPPFRACRLAPAETADAALMPVAFAVQSRVAFYAGLQSRVERRGLHVLARLRSLGWIGDLQPLAPWLQRARRFTRPFATAEGGMTIDIAGLDAAGLHVTARWLLCARNGDGPSVPVLAAMALTRKLLAGPFATGAAVASEALAWDEIAAEMKSLALTVSASVQRSPAALFETALGECPYAELPRALRDFHDLAAPPVWRGRADVTVGRHPIARLLHRLIGFTAEGRELPVTVSVDRKDGEEIWTRNFAGQRFASKLSSCDHGRIVERFGVVDIVLAPEAVGRELRLPVAGWNIGWLPLPRRLAPRSRTREHADAQGRFCFDVAISMPLAGEIVHYRGWLVAQAAGERIIPKARVTDPLLP